MKLPVKLISLLFIFSCSTAQQSGDQKTITGKIDNVGVGEVTLEHFEDNAIQVVDTLTVFDDGTYYSTFEPEEPGYYRLNFFDTQFVNVILTDEPVIVNVDGSGPKAPYEVKGSEVMTDITEVNEIMAEFNQDLARMNQEFSTAAQNNDEAKMEQIREKYTAKMEALNRTVKEKIRKMGTSVAVLQSINYLDPDQEFAFLDSIAQVVDKEMPEYQIKEEFISRIENLRRLAIGSRAPEIALPNPEGEVVELSSLRGNYVLIDFWAAWCGPCRRENPNVVRLYQKYKDKGFEIYGVSLDRKKEDWLKAIETDNLTWTHVSDLNYFNSEAAQKYNIQAIPATYLLDREGNIIGKNLRGKALEDKLEEIFG